VQVGADQAEVPGVQSVHDLHVWDMSPGEPALIGHLEIDDLEQWPKVLAAVKAMLLERHGIDHITLQPETHDACAVSTFLPEGGERTDGGAPGHSS
jgi:cobalt-zinc-cadmium efflux system protein